MIQLDNLHFSYGEQKILENVSLHVPGKSISAIIGPNGAGKSTLVKLIAGLLKPGSGCVRLQGENIDGWDRAHMALQVAYVPQSVEVHFDFSVKEVVAMGRYAHKRTVLGSDENAASAINDALKAMDVYQYRERSFNALSGGEKQRVLIASALAQQSQLLLLDEPTSALDLRHQQSIYRILRRLCKEEGKTVVSVTHDVNLAAQYCDNLLMLHQGRIIRHGAPHDVLKFPVIEEVYGVKVYIDINPFTDSLYILPYDLRD